jgi:hypothetical protein
MFGVHYTSMFPKFTHLFAQVLRARRNIASDICACSTVRAIDRSAIVTVQIEKR